MSRRAINQTDLCAVIQQNTSLPPHIYYCYSNTSKKTNRLLHGSVTSYSNLYLTKTKKVRKYIKKPMKCLLEICVLLGFHAACSGNSLPKFRDNPSVPSSGVKKSINRFWMGPTGCREMSVRNYR